VASQTIKCVENSLGKHLASLKMHVRMWWSSRVSF